MKNSFSPGKFIVFDGIDGSGKATQTKLLIHHLKKENYKVAFIDFPQYGKKSAGLIEEYLNKKYGAAGQVDSYAASIFYACDRYDASFKIRKWLKMGKLVIADRYISANIGHQGGKIKNKKERKKYFKWLYNLEYNIFRISKPDLTLILKVPPKIAQELSGRITDEKKERKKRIYLGRKKRDIHEKDLNHLIWAERAYLHAVRAFPQDFKVIDCVQDKQLLAPKVIHQKIWEVLKEKLKIK